MPGANMDVNSVYQYSEHLDFEIKRISIMCDNWEKTLAQVIPDHAKESILSEVTQARMLISNKMQHFSTLVARCERPNRQWPHAVSRPSDLRRFSDTVFRHFMQADGLSVSLNMLEQMYRDSKKAPIEVASTSCIENMMSALRNNERQNSNGPERLIMLNKILRRKKNNLQRVVKRPRPGTPAGSRQASAAGSRPGTSAGSRPGSSAVSMPGSSASSRPGTPASSRPGSPASSMPGSQAVSSPSSPAGSGSGTPAGSGSGTPAGSGSGAPAGSGSGATAGSGSGAPAGSGSGDPAGSGSGAPAGSGSGSPAGSGPGSPAGSRPGSPAGARQELQPDQPGYIPRASPNRGRKISLLKAILIREAKKAAVRERMRADNENLPEN